MVGIVTKAAKAAKAAAAATETEIGRDEGLRLLDEAAREWLDLSAADFLYLWDTGGFADRDDLAVQQVAMLIPFAR